MKQLIKNQLSKLPDPRTRDGVKSICRFIVARATSATIVTIVHTNTDPENAYETVSVFIGAHVLGEIVADVTAPFVDAKVDSAADALTEAREDIRNAQAELQNASSTL